MSLRERALDGHNQDDDAEWLRNLAKLRFNRERNDIADRLERIASRLSPTPETDQQQWGVPASPSGHSPKGGAASSTASPAKPSVPNA